MSEVKNCNYCYNLYKSEDCKYAIDWDSDVVKCMDVSYIAEIEQCYETAMTAWFRNNFCYLTVRWSNNFYCNLVIETNNCFACVWIKHKQYCILNKQYTKSEYEELVPKIIERMKKDGEWWEYFKASMSPFAYNESLVNEHYPIEKEEALKKWFNWSDYKKPNLKVEKIIPASKLPDNILDIPDDILNWAIECEVSKKPFKIIKKELEYLRKHKLPLPRKHPDIRYLDKFNLKNPRKMHHSNCRKCWKDITTTFEFGSRKKVYCEKCYESEIY